MGNHRRRKTVEIGLGHDQATVIACGRPGGRHCLCLLLPEPPSVNHIWRRGHNGRTYRDNRYERWTRHVELAVTADQMNGHLQGFSPSLPVTVFIFSGSERKDIDNCIKPVIDGLVHSGILKDDDMDHVRAVFATKAWFDIPRGNLICLIVDKLNSGTIMNYGLPRPVLDWLESAAHLAFRRQEESDE